MLFEVDFHFFVLIVVPVENDGKFFGHRLENGSFYGGLRSIIDRKSDIIFTGTSDSF